MELNALIQRYHDFLTEEMGEEADALLRGTLKERGLYFGSRPICTVLRPYFYAESDWQFMKSRLEALLGAFAVAHQVCMSDSKYRAQLHLDSHEEALHSIDKDSPFPWSSSRLDTFFVLDKRSLKCVEYNAETPAGIGYNDVLADVFDELPAMKDMKTQAKVEAMRSLQTLTDAVVKAYRDWGGTNQPQIAIIDWQDVPTLNEHEITRLHFERNGYKAVMADPRSLEYHDGALWAGDFRIDIVYKRVLYSELLERMGLDNPVLKAVRDKAVFITNSPSAKLMAKKASLALMSDEQNAHLFSPEQRQIINEYIPWSRVVAERKTQYQGREIDLLPFIAEQRENLVLKPNDEYGGKGVILGWECSHEDWQATIRQALNSPYVVQEKVPMLQRKFPTWVDGRLDISNRYVDADPYAFNGATVYGCLTRLSGVALLNVTAGGGSVVPTYVVRE